MRTRHGFLPTVAPAWPTLIGVQVVVVAALVGAAWRAGLAPAAMHSPLQARVLDLDTASAGAAVDAALLVQKRDARALAAADQNRTVSFLSLTASAADLVLVRADWSTRPDPSDAAVLDADLRLELAGDVFDLPAFLDGLHRQSALARVRALAVSVAPGGAARAWVSLRYARPVAEVPDDDVARRVARTVPAATDAARELIVDAARLARWRRFARHTAERSAASDRVRARLMRELPAALVAVRSTGGTVSWSAERGAVVSPNPKRR